MKEVARFLILYLGSIITLMLTWYGLLLACKVSLILGIIVLLLEPTPFILGLLALLGHPEVSKQIAHWLGL